MLDPTFTANLMLIANGNEFATDIRELNDRTKMLALITCLLFLPAAWIAGTRMSTTLKSITSQAEHLQAMTSPSKPIGSFVRELNTLGTTVYQAQRAVWSFSRLAPREIVRGVLDGTISTELGGKRQEITAFFTDVRGFTTLSEKADPDVLMRQTSRYFTALSEVMMEQGGTIDKFIGDGRDGVLERAKPAGWIIVNGPAVQRCCRARRMSASIASSRPKGCRRSTRATAFTSAKRWSEISDRPSG